MKVLKFYSKKFFIMSTQEEYTYSFELHEKDFSGVYEAFFTKP